MTVFRPRVTEVIAKMSGASAPAPEKTSSNMAVTTDGPKEVSSPRPLSPLLRKWSWAISFLFVGLMTALLFELQAYLIQYDGHKLIRPYVIGYLMPIILLTALAGRGAGLFTLFLSCLAATFFLAQPYFSFHVTSDRTQVEMVLLVTVGLSAVYTVGAGREKALMLADINGTAEGNVIQRQVRQIAEAVPGVLLLQNCILRRRGVDIYVDLDVVVDQNQPQREARDITDAVEQALHRANPLIFQARVRAR